MASTTTKIATSMSATKSAAPSFPTVCYDVDTIPPWPVGFAVSFTILIVIVICIILVYSTIYLRRRLFKILEDRPEEELAERVRIQSQRALF
ncbi:uncharacterized protein LY89DRAFT_687110 [Mollisia scopiformis]|uniref:Uncharacterized protein n=1 Tax=Mollisia scopiformis TaxID=149040 RepID=A0A194X0K4_MOLSC|nr:uncharacterized protein LY89DRAFT_687110 [Mollisia scopiformis]KUJ13728.1 hypothetical protein LY89DRAFT_687110 [Mollisia scopiformis]